MSESAKLVSAQETAQASVVSIIIDTFQEHILGMPRPLSSEDAMHLRAHPAPIDS